MKGKCWEWKKCFQHLLLNQKVPHIFFCIEHVQSDWSDSSGCMCCFLIKLHWFLSSLGHRRNDPCSWFLLNLRKKRKEKKTILYENSSHQGVFVIRSNHNIVSGIWWVKSVFFFSLCFLLVFIILTCSFRLCRLLSTNTIVGPPWG